MSETFAGKYELLDEISSGGFGTVYRAKQRSLDRLVALKVLRAAAALDRETRSRFEREATVMSSFRHKNIVGFYGYGIDHDVPYIAMEYIQGTDLQTFINKHDKLSLRKTVVVALQVAAALAAAHDAGIVHRDLKPSNIMLENGDLDSVKLIDFGLARIFADRLEEQRITKEGTCVGTIAYMSPEQCLGQAADFRSDIYSLGCVMYRCLAGAAPYKAENSVFVMHRHVYDPVPSIVDGSTDASKEAAYMQEILDGCLAKEPSERFQSVPALIEKLRQLHDLCIGRQSEVLTVLPDPPASAPRAPNTVSPIKPQYLLFAAALMLVTGSAAAILIQGQSNNNSVPIPPVVQEAERLLSDQKSISNPDRLKIAAMIGALETASDSYKLRKNADPRMVAHILFLQSKLSAAAGEWGRCEQELEDALVVETKNGIQDKEFTEIGESLVKLYLDQRKPRAGIECARTLISRYESAPTPLDSRRLKEMLKDLEQQ